MIKLKILLSAIIAGAGIVFCLTGCAADDENDVINDNLTTFTSAGIVLGQADFNTAASGTARSGMNQPSSAAISGTKLLVLDSVNHRILIWNTMPTENGQAADSVLGQSSMTTGTAGTSGTELKVVKGLFSLNGKIYVSDTGNNRIMIWNSIPATSGTAADIVIGQGDFTHSAYNDDDQDGAADLTPTARTLNQPMGLFYSNGTLLVADSGNNRLLIYK